MTSDNNKLIAYILLVVLLNGFFSINIIEKNRRFYNSQLNNQMAITKTLRSELTEFYKYGVVVDVTMYRPTKHETDSTPNITADGTQIRISKASDYKFVALSRNLLKRWGGPFDYGDFILLKGAKDKDGVYQVRDTMNSKWVNVVDILESEDVEPYKYMNAHIFKLPWVDKVKDKING